MPLLNYIILLIHVHVAVILKYFLHIPVHTYVITLKKIDTFTYRSCYIKIHTRFACHEQDTNCLRILRPKPLEWYDLNLSLHQSNRLSKLPIKVPTCTVLAFPSIKGKLVKYFISRSIATLLLYFSLTFLKKRDIFT